MGLLMPYYTEYEVPLLVNFMTKINFTTINYLLYKRLVSLPLLKLKIVKD